MQVKRSRTMLEKSTTKEMGPPKANTRWARYRGNRGKEVGKKGSTPSDVEIKFVSHDGPSNTRRKKDGAIPPKEDPF